MDKRLNIAFIIFIVALVLVAIDWFKVKQANSDLTRAITTYEEKYNTLQEEKITLNNSLTSLYIKNTEILTEKSDLISQLEARDQKIVSLTRITAQIDTIYVAGTADTVHVNNTVVYTKNTYQQGVNTDFRLVHPTGDFNLIHFFDPIDITAIITRSSIGTERVNVVLSNPHIKVRDLILNYEDNSKTSIFNSLEIGIGMNISNNELYPLGLVGYRNVLVGVDTSSNGFLAYKKRF